MSDTTRSMAVDQTTSRSGPTLMSRALTYGACAISAALFLSVGWFALEPDDPMGSVSFLARQDGVVAFAQAAVLAAVAGGLATLIAGRRLVDIGIFAAAFGLLLVSLRGSTAASLLIEYADGQVVSQRTAALRFALEASGWIVVLLAAVAASTLVMRWCCGAGRREGSEAGGRLSEAELMAGDDIPWPSGWGSASTTRTRTPLADGWKHVVIATIAGTAAMFLLSRGLSERSIRHGQVCFVVALAVFIGVYVGYRFYPVRSALWPILSVMLMAILGYLWAAVRSASSGGPPSLPASAFMRVLPIQFLSMGAASALAGFWHLDYHAMLRAPERSTTPGKASPRERA